MYIADATELIRIDQIAGARAQTWCDLGCGTGTFTLALATLLPPRQRHPCHRQRRKIVIADSRPVSRRNHPQGGCEPGKERSLFACARWRAHGQFPAFHQTPGGFHRKATDPVRAIAGCRIRWQAAKSMGTIPARLLCLARLAPGTRI